ncbi:hypothetical protein HMSSN036_00020 [Paenibacillus macerans]|nr:hypothetical protein HMSSN036_00020 [Paenibacillus macerans]
MKIWDIPLLLRTAAISINGTDRVESVTLADVTGTGEVIPGSEREERVDFAALAGGLYPLAELAAVAGCPFVHVPELGGHIPLHNEQLQTPVEGLYVAAILPGSKARWWLWPRGGWPPRPYAAMRAYWEPAGKASCLKRRSRSGACAPPR